MTRAGRGLGSRKIACRALLCASFLCWLLRGEVRLQAQTVPAIQQAAVLGQDLLVKSGSTGLLLVVVRGKETFVQGFGQTSPGSGVTPDRNSLVRLCSLTKIFTTDLLVKLMQDGRVRLDEPLQRLAPPGGRVPMLPQERPVTLGDLATHTAGLPREVGPAPRGTPHFTFPSEAFRWAWLPEQRLKSAPGTVALYSNVGFDLLGDALADAVHEPYPALLEQRTIGPLGMRETTFTPTPAQCARLLGTARPEGPCTSTVNSAGSSGLYSTASDMERWLEYLLGTDTPAIPAQSAAAQAVYVQPGQLIRVEGLDHAGQPTGIGLGWVHAALPPEAASADRDILEKTGGGAGFLTYIALNLATHTAVFVAATDGRSERPLNLFKAANNVLLTLAGLPTFPPEMAHPVAKPHGRARKTRRGRPGAEDRALKTGR